MARVGILTMSDGRGDIERFVLASGGWMPRSSVEEQEGPAGAVADGKGIVDGPRGRGHAGPMPPKSGMTGARSVRVGMRRKRVER